MVRTSPIVNPATFIKSGVQYTAFNRNYSITPTLVSLSAQNAGTINGGSVVSITGTNFYAGMTSTLGTVSVTSATTATITTNSGTAGTFPFYVQNAASPKSNSINYVYIAHPTTPSISPIDGPVSTTQAATITSSNLGYGYTDVPVNVYVGGLTTTSVVVTNATTITCVIPSGGTLGAASVVVDVDGALATGSNMYTFRGVPVVSSVSQNAGTINGSTVINVVGTGFVSGMTSTLGTVSSVTATTCSITTN